MGSFEVELYDNLKPITAGNFKKLVNEKFYDGVIFHRIIDNFVIQGGDPTGTGSGGPGYSIDDEFDSTLSNVVKTLSMANSGPNTGGSQFFINMKNNTFLDFDKAPLSSAHPVFGIVISGWDTVEMIEAVPVNGNDRPLNDVIMDSVRVTQFPLGIGFPVRSQSEISVYPNPANSGSMVQIKSEKEQTVTVSLYTLSGSKIVTNSHAMHKGMNHLSLMDVGATGLPRGAYCIKVQYEDQTRIARFILAE
jgi:peptidylprolyl isomerase